MHRVAQFLKPIAIRDTERWLRDPEFQKGRRQAPAAIEEALPSGECVGDWVPPNNFKPLPVAHHWYEQRLCTRDFFVLESYNVVGIFSILAGGPKDLFAARVRLLLRAELGSAANMVMELDFNEFVDDADRGSIRGGGEGRANAKGIHAP
ncbi:MAG: hypothetical protein ACXV96_03910, partial [Candidatus Angelobacter sp.]